MNDPRAVALKLRSIGVALLRILAAARFAGFLRVRRERRSLGRFHLLACFPPGRCAHWFDVDPCASDLNFSRNARSARRASSLSSNKSKSARSDAVKVSQTHTIQKKITSHGCSCGFKTGARKVKPEIKSRTATPSRTA